MLQMPWRKYGIVIGASILGLVLAGCMLWVFSPTEISAAGFSQDQTDNKCFVETTGDQITDFQSSDATALQQAVDSAEYGDLLKVAGTCAGAQIRDGHFQTLYITQSVTIRGGYTTTNWLSDPDVKIHQTTLDAQGLGRVLYITYTPDVYNIVYIENLILTGGNTNGNGGGIYTDHMEAVFSNDVISNNTATGFGGGIYHLAGYTRLYNCIIQNNTATIDAGGGIYFDSGTMEIQNSTINNNQALNSSGGGIFNYYGDLDIMNSTISSNTTYMLGGGIFNNGLLDIWFSSIISNTADSGGGGLRHVNVQAIIANTMIAQNSGGDCSWNPVDDYGYNLDSDSTCGWTSATSLSEIDPQLTELSDNDGQLTASGKPAFTHRLLPGSLALDQIPKGENGCGTIYMTDQRGLNFLRRSLANCDIGAFELDYVGLEIFMDGDGTGLVTSDPAGIYCIDQWCSTAYPHGASLELTATADPDSIFAGWSGSCTGTETCPIIMDFSKPVTATFNLDNPVDIFFVYLPLIIR